MEQSDVKDVSGSEGLHVEDCGRFGVEGSFLGGAGGDAPSLAESEVGSKGGQFGGGGGRSMVNEGGGEGEEEEEEQSSEEEGTLIVLKKDLFTLHQSTIPVYLFDDKIGWGDKDSSQDERLTLHCVQLRTILGVKVIQEEDERTVPNNAKKKSKMGGRLSRINCFPSKKKAKEMEYRIEVPMQAMEIRYLTCVEQKRKKEEDVNKKWKLERIRLFHQKQQVLLDWAAEINDMLEVHRFNRPKNILFILNPFGGEQKAEKVLHESVLPIMSISRVMWTVIETEGKNSATETLQKMSQEELDKYDCVVAVGGDGTLCEVVNGLLTRNLDPENIPLGEEETLLKPVRVSIGVIPAGSTNAVSYTVYGTVDPEIIAAHVILGAAVPLDVASIHSQAGLIRFIVGQMSYGFLADVMVSSERLRFIGPRRYAACGVARFVKLESYHVAVDIIEDCSEKQSIPCKGDGACNGCKSNDVGQNLLVTRQLKGKYVSVIACNMSLKTPNMQKGLAPHAHLANGSLDLLCLRDTSRCSFLRFLKKLQSGNSDAYYASFVEIFRIKSFTLTPLPDDDKSQCCCLCTKAESAVSAWNCDGELLLEPEVHVKVHSHLLRVVAPQAIDSQKLTLSFADKKISPSLWSTEGIGE